MASRCMPVFFIVAISLIVSISEARQILVGGRNGSWSIPSSSSLTLNQWAEQTRFQIGDVLVWIYDSQKDSVLQVTQKDYQSCNTSSPIVANADGNTTVTLDRSGTFYFISGAKGACEKGEKLHVVVLTPRAQAPAAAAPASEGSVAPPPVSSATRFGGLGVAVVAGLMMVVLMVRRGGL